MVVATLLDEKYLALEALVKRRDELQSIASQRLSDLSGAELTAAIARQRQARQQLDGMDSAIALADLEIQQELERIDQRMADDRLKQKASAAKAAYELALEGVPALAEQLDLAARQYNRLAIEIREEALRLNRLKTAAIVAERATQPNDPYSAGHPIYPAISGCETITGHRLVKNGDGWMTIGDWGVAPNSEV